MRTVLSTLGVVIGVASLVAILSLSDGLERFSREQLERTTDLQSIAIIPKTMETIEGVAIRRTNPILFAVTDADSLAAVVGSRAFSMLMVTGSDRAALAGDTGSVPALVIAVTAGSGEVLGIVVDTGRFLNARDLEQGSPVAVLSRRAAVRLGGTAPPGSLLGRNLVLRTGSYQIAGIVGVEHEGDVARIYLPLTEEKFARISREEGKVAQAVVTVPRVEDIEAVRTDVEAWLGSKAGAAADHFLVVNSRQRVAQVQQAMLVFKLVMGSIAGIALIVGGIGIMNILLASVSERTREIGIRRASGARSRDILLQFLAESLAIAGLGSLLGVAFGLLGSVLIAAVIRSLSQAPLHAAFTWSSIAAAVGAACIVGFTFGLYPARKASRLSPTEAIRYE